MLKSRPVRFVSEVFREFTKDGCDALAGSLAFFTLFSVAPLLALVVDVAGMIADPDRVTRALRHVVSRLSGAEVADQTVRIVEAFEVAHAETLPGRLLGLLFVLFTATVVLAQAQRALNTVWSVPPRRGFRGFLIKRGISLGLILGFMLALLASIGIGAALSTLGPRLALLLPPTMSHTAARWVPDLLAFALLATFTTAMHGVLPDVRVPWQDVVWGGVVTAVLLQLGQIVISWIIATASMGSVYGAARSLALLLFWVFYASALFLWGAEFIKVLARWRGHECEPLAEA